MNCGLIFPTMIHTWQDFISFFDEFIRILLLVEINANCHQKLFYNYQFQ
jgi:hypothetical protein